MRRILWPLPMLLVLAGCANLSSIYRTPKIEDNEWLVMSAEQRVVSNVAADTARGRNKPQRIICPEPSPDVAKSVSSAFTLGIEAIRQSSTPTETESTSARVQGSRAVTESLVQLGQRVATLQLLRDELSDLCRSYANGAITSTTYSIRLSKLDKKMVTLLSTEGAAGALGKALAAIEGSAVAGQGQAVDAGTVDEASKRLNTTTAELIAARKAAVDTEKELAAEKAKDKPDKAVIAEKETRLRDAQSTIEQKVGEVGRLQFEFTLALMGHSRQGVGAGARVLPGQAQGGNGGHPLGIAEMQRAFLQADDMTTLIDACLTTLDALPEPDSDGQSQQERSLIQARDQAQANLDDLRLQLDRLENEVRAQSRPGAKSSPEDTGRYFELKVQAQVQFDKRQELDKRLADFRAKSVAQSRTPLSSLCEAHWPKLLQASTEIATAQRVSAEQRSLGRQEITRRCLDVMLRPAAETDAAARDFCKAQLGGAAKPPAQ